MRPELRGLCGLVLLVFLAGCGAGDDEESRLRERLDAMETALEAGEIRSVMAGVAEDFTSTRSGLDRRALELLLRRERLARESITIQRSQIEVEIHDGGRATLRFHALATGGSGWLPDEGRLWAFETGWRLDDGDWKLVRADWTPLIGTG